MPTKNTPAAQPLAAERTAEETLPTATTQGDASVADTAKTLLADMFVPQPTHITVRARDERGFRRAGRFWASTPTTVDIEEFTPDQIEALVNERELEVAFVVEEQE